MDSSKRWDILGLGCVAVDDLLYLDSFPHPDTKQRIHQRQRQCGGLTGNALVAAARLGARCAFAGTLGTDDASRFVLDTFLREGIDTSAVRIIADARPIRSTILVDQSQNTRTILFDLSGTTAVSEDWPPESVISSSRFVYVDHYGIDGMIRAAKLAHASGGVVVADLERNEWPCFDELLTLIDHVVVNQAFACKLTGCPDAKSATEKLVIEGRSAVVVTCGANGCWWMGEGNATAQLQPAFSVNVVDTTGCGDIFHGAYAAALVRGLPLAERVRIASAAAAIKATKHGGQHGAPSWDELAAFLERTDRDTPARSWSSRDWPGMGHHRHTEEESSNTMTEERLRELANDVYNQDTSGDREKYTDEEWYLREVWDEGYEYDFEAEDLIQCLECDWLSLDEEQTIQELNRSLETLKGQCMYRTAMERGKIDENGNRLKA